MSKSAPKQNGWSWVICACFVVVVSGLSGCANLFESGGLELPSFSKKSEIPNHLVAIWTDTILQQPGQPGIRGMGGRLMFYGVEEKKTLLVDGKLTVFVYDDTEKKSSALPARKYVFLPEHVQEHYSKSKLGHSYSFWLPWDEAGGPSKQLTIVTRFEPTGGGAIISEPSHQFLPGVASQPIVEKRIDGIKTEIASSSEEVKQTSHNAPDNKNEKNTAMDTITIDVPPDFVSKHFGANSGEQPGQRGDSLWQKKPSVDAMMQLAPPTVGQTAAIAPGKTAAAREEGAAREDAHAAGLPLRKLQAPSEPGSQPDAGPSRTRQRLEAWLADRRASRQSFHAGQSAPRR